jgi:hypothetical protein
MHCRELAQILCFSSVAALSLTAGFASSQTNPYEMRYQFDQNGIPSIHTFVLKWTGPESNLQSIEVQVSETKEVIQTINIPQDKVKLAHKDLQEKKDHIKEKIIDSVDYNFDKFADLRILREYPYAVGNKYYLIWLFDQEKNQYVLHEGISALQNPQVNPKTRRIETISLGAYGGGEFTKQYYSINMSGRLRVQTSITQNIFDKARLTFVRDIRTRVSGEMQKVCRMEILPEGKPVKLWGKRWWCDQFSLKEIPR